MIYIQGKLLMQVYNAFTETGAIHMIKTYQRAELKQQIPTFLDLANQMSGTER